MSDHLGVGDDAVPSGMLRWRPTLGAIASLAALFALPMILAACSGSSHSPGHLYVSPHGSDRSGCTQARPCRSLTHAVAVAHPGEQIDVEPGLYREGVSLTKRLTISGSHSPVLDAKGHGQGILIRGAAAAGSVVRGLVVENAGFEGILALSTERVTITDNTVRNNDRAYFAPHFFGECKAHDHPPVVVLGDLRRGGCGEAIHLASTSNSRVVKNFVTGNTGGIYLTDESGPASHNLIAGNRVLANIYDCGITLASHSQRAVTRKDQLRPQAGGVYDNTIRDNIANRNGTRVPGSGILVAAAFTGGAAYDNRIVDNTVNDNGLPGVTLHSHDPHQNLSGNVIVDNVVGLNGVGGAKGGPGDDDAGIHHTAGILVWSAFTRIAKAQVSGNRISGNYFGIWTQNTPRVAPNSNFFRDVRVPLSQH